MSRDHLLTIWLFFNRWSNIVESTSVRILGQGDRDRDFPKEIIINNMGRIRDPGPESLHFWLLKQKKNLPLLLDTYLDSCVRECIVIMVFASLTTGGSTKSIDSQRTRIDPLAVVGTRTRRTRQERRRPPGWLPVTSVFCQASGCKEICGYIKEKYMVKIVLDGNQIESLN